MVVIIITVIITGINNKKRDCDDVMIICFLCYDYYYSFLVWLCYDYYNLFFRMIMLWLLLLIS